MKKRFIRIYFCFATNFIISGFLFINFSQTLADTEIDTIYYLPANASFYHTYSIAGEIYNIHTRFTPPAGWSFYKVKEIHYLISHMMLGDTIKNISLYKDTLKTSIYTQGINDILDSTDVYPNWYKVVIMDSNLNISGVVEVIGGLGFLCAAINPTVSGNTLGFYEANQNWGICSDFPIKLVIERGATDIDENFQAKKSFNLWQNYPNPFNPTTKIKFSIPRVETFRETSLLVTLNIYDILGNEVATLVNEEKEPGEYEVEFNGTKFPSGVYFYQLRVGNFVETKKMILLQ